MRHITREEAMIAGVLRATRIIAVIGASPRPTRHSHEVVSYLHRVGFDVVPVRPDVPLYPDCRRLRASTTSVGRSTWW